MTADGALVGVVVSDVDEAAEHLQSLFPCRKRSLTGSAIEINGSKDDRKWRVKLCPTPTGQKIQQLLDSYGISQRGAARQLGIAERTLRVYILNERAIPKATLYALRWLLHCKRAGVSPDD